MHKRTAIAAICWLSLSACAHHSAVRVDCEGPLRPINAPTPVTKAKPGPSSTLPDPSAPKREGDHDQ